MLQEACESEFGKCICDIHATLDHVLTLRQTLPTSDFEKEIQNLTCFNFTRLPKYFYVDTWRQRVKNQNIKLKGIDETVPKATKWDWIRRKRSLLSTSEDEGNYFENDNDFEDPDMYSNDEYFEKMYKGKDNVFKRKKRLKRTPTDMKELASELKDLPPLKPAKVRQNMY